MKTLPPPLLSCAINRVLHQHTAKTIDTFRLSLSPRGVPAPHSAVDRIEYVAEKRVRELDIGFTRSPCPLVTITSREMISSSNKLFLPCLISCDSLAILRLANCKFELPRSFRGFSFLKTLHPTRAVIEYFTLKGILLDCPMLEDLALMGCDNLEELFVPTTIESKIKNFALAGCDMLPNMLCQLASFLASFAAHLQILTIRHLRIRIYSLGPITLPNLIELQLGVSSNRESLNDIYALFLRCNFPCLEKIMVKINRFDGRDKQMEMVKFLLQKAVV
ncbi:F-box/FBD/LRR-repeat protein [Cinnamomum micranthum f. kanehirae]|uniref:F-box/FBD/LRR-repeat protein n=1 Tax=Cinnamomum micranthum f. kanehirae TaxID=337451 RepID=A0A443P5Z4_9MAGN|nr:F-box/FBD/LRR-repeat protein [Cinnamomum micranthum f. kanehirae]